jgi:hypothetical protein
MAVFRGVNAECKPTRMETHRVDLRSFRLGKYRIAG